MPFSQRLDPSHYTGVQDDVSVRIREAGLDGLLLDHPEDVAYLTGFFHHPCERPVVVWVGADADTALLVPKLEEDHARWQEASADLLTYHEFPGVIEPLSVLAERVPRGLDASASPPPRQRVDSTCSAAACPGPSSSPPT